MTEPNTHFPGLPDYIGPTSGVFGCVHHDTLYEWSSDIMERVEYTKLFKPQSEQETRLRCLVYLDPTELPAELNKMLSGQGTMWTNWDKMLSDWNKAQAEWDKIWTEWNKALAKWNHIWAEQDKAQAECDRRNKLEHEMASKPSEYPGFVQGFWSIRECVQN